MTIKDAAIKVFERFLLVRIENKIATALMSAGVAILGFSNGLPLILIAFKPELKNTIEYQLSLVSYIGISLLIIGALIPLIVLMVRHYSKNYSKDIETLEKIHSIIRVRDFDNVCQHIQANLSMSFQMEDMFENLHTLILDPDFLFFDRKQHQLAKELGEACESFHSKMGLYVEGIQNMYIVPREKRNDKTIDDIRNMCRSMLIAYHNFESYSKQRMSTSMLRFFAS